MPDTEGSFAMRCNPEGGCFVTVALPAESPPRRALPLAHLHGKLLPQEQGCSSCSQLSSSGDLGCRASACSEWAPALPLGCVPKTGVGTQKRNQHKPRVTPSGNPSSRAEGVTLMESPSCKLLPGQSTVRPEPSVHSTHSSSPSQARRQFVNSPSAKKPRI